MIKRSLSILSKLALSCAALYLTSCSPGVLSQRGSYLREFHAGNLEQAECHLNQVVQQEIPDEQFTRSKNASWLLLDRATTRFAIGKTEEAICDFAKALESLDYYDQEVPAERVAQVMLQDEAGAYQASDFEQVLARVYFCLALLHQGDESNAFAILRQAEEYQQVKRNLYAKIPFTKNYQLADNGLSKYLFAVLLEKKGDRANAKILYQQASALIPFIDRTYELNNYPDGQATVLVLCHNGKAPYKISATSPASVASAAALEILLGARGRDPAISTLVGIPVPALQQWPFSNPLPTFACLDGTSKSLLPYYNIQKAAADDLKQQMPVIAARGAARLILRRGAVDYMQKKDPALGDLADLTMCLINVNTRADTRSWTTLPGTIDLTRFQASPGVHQLNIQVQDPITGSRNYSYQLMLEPNALCVVHVFNIQPGNTRVLIPSRYLINQGE